MNNQTSLNNLIEKVEQQGNTITQLVKIIAATNQRVSELQIQLEDVTKEKSHFM